MRIPTPSEAVAYAGSASSIFAGLKLSEWGVIIGMGLAAATFGLNAYFGWRKDKREAEAHARRMRDGGEICDGT